MVNAATQIWGDVVLFDPAALWLSAGWLAPAVFVL
jgi:hypothetical protein